MNWTKSWPAALGVNGQSWCHCGIGPTQLLTSGLPRDHSVPAIIVTSAQPEKLYIVESYRPGHDAFSAFLFPS